MFWPEDMKTSETALDPKGKKQKPTRGSRKMVKGNVLWLRLVNKGHVMTSMGMWQGRGGRGILGPDVHHVLSISKLHAAGVYRTPEASAQALRPGPGPWHGYLVDLVLVKALELPLEAKVGVGAWSPSTHGAQGILPAKASDSHDVRSHQRHTPGDTGQAVGPREHLIGKACAGHTCIS